MTPGRTYRFVHDNTGSHPLKFYLEADKTTLYSTGVTFDNAYTEIVVSDSTPTILHYQCTNHGYMGNAVQVNSNISGGLVGTPDIDCGTGSFTGDVDIADKIIHTGDTNTAIRFPAADTFTVETGGSERLRVSSNVGVGDDNPSVKLNVKGSGDSLAGLNVHSKIEDTTSLAANVGGMLAFEGVYTSGDAEAVYAAIHGGKENATDGNYAGYLRAFTRPNGGLPAERLRIDSSGNVSIATPSALGRLHVRPADECNFVVREESTSLVLSAETNSGRDNNRLMTLEGNGFVFNVGGSEKLRLNSSGKITGVGFTGFLREGINIVSGKLSDNTTINIDHSMVHYFTTAESTTGIPNFTSTAGINTDLSVGETFSVNVITTAAAAGYSTGARIDAGATLPVLWNGGTDPSAGGSAGVDAYTYQVIKTGDEAFTILGNVSNFA